MTTQYAKLINGRPDFAGEVITLPDGRKVANPKETHLLAAGYFPVPDDIAPPTPPEGKVARFMGWAVVDGYAAPQYELVDAPPPPMRSFNRYKVVMALKSEGVWKDIRSAMLAEDEDALDMLYTAEDISEDEPLLLGMIAVLKAAPFNWTDEKVEAVLSAATNGGAL